MMSLFLTQIINLIKLRVLIYRLRCLLWISVVRSSNVRLWDNVETGSYLDVQKFSPHFWEIY